MGITQMSVSNGVALHTPEELIAIHRAAGDAVVRLTRWADNFPGPGVRFADLTPVFADAEGGFGGPCSTPLSPVLRTPTRLPPSMLAGSCSVPARLRRWVLGWWPCGRSANCRRRYSLVRTASSTDPRLSRSPANGFDLTGRNVLVIDDVLATGGTLEAAVQLVELGGANVVGVAVVLEIEELRGRDRFLKYPLTSLVKV